MTLRALLYDKSELSPVFWDVIEKWWRDLDKNRGARARLRRAKTPDEVFVSPDYQRGLRPLLECEGITLDHKEAAKLAIGIGVLVFSKTPNEDTQLSTIHFARQLAEKDQPGETLRDSRFRKLLSTTDATDLLIRLRRLSTYIGQYVEYKSLIQGASDWTDSTRHKWGVAYYYDGKSKK